MSYRNPRWCVLHAAKDAGVSAITVLSEDANFPKENLIDDRAGSVFKNASAAVQTIVVDRGAGTLEAVDRIFFPNPGNLELGTGGWTLEAADDSGFTTNLTSLVASGTIQLPGSTTPVSEEFTSNAQRYVRFTSASSVILVIPQLILSKVRTTERGPAADWRGPTPRSNVLAAEKSSGAVAHFQRGPDRNEYRFEYRRVKETDDLAALDALFAAGEASVFVFDPPDTTDPSILATVARRERQNDHPAPAGISGRRLLYEFELLEHLG